MYTNPIEFPYYYDGEFPCPYDGENTNIQICEDCPCHDRCDTFITMLNESFDS